MPVFWEFLYQHPIPYQQVKKRTFLIPHLALDIYCTFGHICGGLARRNNCNYCCIKYKVGCIMQAVVYMYDYGISPQGPITPPPHQPVSPSTTHCAKKLVVIQIPASVTQWPYVVLL